MEQQQQQQQQQASKIYWRLKLFQHPQPPSYKPTVNAQIRSCKNFGTVML
jgi:hypothetical protein